MRRSAAKSNRTTKALAWTLGSLAGLAALAYVGGQWWLSRYLHSDELRKKIEERSGITLRAKVDVSAPRFDGSQFYTDGFSAQGTKEASFGKITVENIRGDYRLPSFLKLVLGERQVDAENIEVQRVNADFSMKDRLDLALPNEDPGAHNVNVKNVTVRDLQMHWPDVNLTGSTARINPMEGGWKVDGEGGKLVMWTLPALDLTSARLVYKTLDQSVIVQEARARAAGGDITATGEIDPKAQADLRLIIKDVSVTPLLPEDWRARLHGHIEGEGRVKAAIHSTDAGQWTLGGNVHLKDGVIEFLPVLEKIARYTRTDEFRHLHTDQVSGDFAYDHAAHTLHVTNFVLESRQLIRLTGAFDIRGEQLNGTFAVGINPAKFRWMMGAEDKVFNVQHDGYAWTDMRVAGTTSSPTEDLSQRLIVAGGEAVVEGVTQKATEAAGTVLDVGKKAADTAIEKGLKAANGASDLFSGKPQNE